MFRHNMGCWDYLALQPFASVLVLMLFIINSKFVFCSCCGGCKSCGVGFLGENPGGIGQKLWLVFDWAGAATHLLALHLLSNKTTSDLGNFLICSHFILSIFFMDSVSAGISLVNNFNMMALDFL